jgi:two-component system, LuxR family, sensor kinase FixL
MDNFTNTMFPLEEIQEFSPQSKSEILRLNQELVRQNDLLEQTVDDRTEHLAKLLNQILLSNKKMEAEIAERQRIERILRQHEQEMHKALHKERELGELKSRFLSTASHEFRTPLSSILSSAEILDIYAQKEGNEKFGKHVERIKSSVSQLTHILNDFLSISKLDEGKVKPTIETFDFDAFCHETLDETKGLCKKGQNLVHHYPTIGFISTDKKLLKNILFNLVSNALKYSPEGANIECKAMLCNGLLRMSILDYGIGIPEKEQTHLFTNFFRASNAENIQGTGLGLAIVKRYVELLQGQITCKSEEGQGSEFTFTIKCIGVV